jgi:O-antigen ligase
MTTTWNPTRSVLRPLPTAAVLGGGATFLAVAAALALVSGRLMILEAAMALLALAGLSYLSVWAPPGVFVALALAGTVLSGNSKRLGFPIGPDRLLWLAALASLALGLPGVDVARRITWRPVHFVLAATAAYAGVSALHAGTLTSSIGFFALLDRLGILPFLAFALAPLLFGTKRQRDVLLLVLVLTGLYLGLTTLFEAVNLDFLVFPRYISDPNVGYHFGRARGPFVEGVANGLALYGCAIASAVAAYTWPDRPRLRKLALVVCGICLLGTIFTLTRAVWLATATATTFTAMLTGRTRRYIAPLVIVAAIAVIGALALVPSFGNRFQERTGDQRSVWDRYNSNLAGVRAVRDQPLFGIGWQSWPAENSKYLKQSNSYPLTGTNIEIHNVLLSHAAELGLIGASLWAAGFALAVGGGILRSGPSELDPWRLGLIALGIHFSVVAAFGPLSYAFPNLLLWLWAGVCSIGHLSVPIEREA